MTLLYCHHFKTYLDLITIVGEAIDKSLDLGAVSHTGYQDDQEEGKHVINTTAP